MHHEFNFDQPALNAPFCHDKVILFIIYGSFVVLFVVYSGSHCIARTGCPFHSSISDEEELARQRANEESEIERWSNSTNTL